MPKELLQQLKLPQLAQQMLLAMPAKPQKAPMLPRLVLKVLRIVLLSPQAPPPQLNQPPQFQRGVSKMPRSVVLEMSHRQCHLALAKPGEITFQPPSQLVLV